MGRASSLLGSTQARLGAAAALGGCLGAYYAWSESLWHASLWWDVAFLSLVLIPAAFGLVYIALPLRTAPGLLVVGLAFVGLAAAFEAADVRAAADFSKLAAATAIGFWFVRAFDTASLVALVALLIPFVDAYSVWRGPTKSIVTGHPEVYTTLSFALPVPGEPTAAHLGPPDLLFFAFFLAAASRFQLRVGWTWLVMSVSFGATLAIAVWQDYSGLPALPGLSLGFLVVNADLLWRSLRAERRSGRSSPSGRDRAREP